MKVVRWGLLTGLLVLAGCGQFFPPLKNNGGGGGGGGSTTGNYLYVANSAPKLDTIAGFSLSGGSLSSTSGSPYKSPLLPSCMAMTPDNSRLYVGSTSGAIYLYTVGSDGSLSLGNGGTPVFTGGSPTAMKVDETGKWLLAVSAFSGEAYVLGIDSSTGALTNVTGGTVGLKSTTANGLAISPNDEYVFVTLGTGGVETLTFNSSTGALTPLNTVAPKQNLDADMGVAVSPNGKYLYVTETGINAVRVFSIASDGTLTEVRGSPFQTGLGPSAVLADSSGNYVYVANRTSNSISAFTIGANGALAVISGSPFSTGTTPMAMAEDKTGTYLAVVNQGGGPDLQVFSIGAATTTAPGALSSTATSSTGTDPAQAGAIVATQ